MNVNVWDVHDTLRDLIRSGHAVDAHRIADPNEPLDGPAAETTAGR